MATLGMVEKSDLLFLSLLGSCSANSLLMLCRRACSESISFWGYLAAMADWIIFSALFVSLLAMAFLKVRNIRAGGVLLSLLVVFIQGILKRVSFDEQSGLLVPLTLDMRKSVQFHYSPHGAFWGGGLLLD